MGIEGGGELRLSDYALADLWALWWRVGRALATSLVAKVALRMTRNRQRDGVGDLDQRMLQDIGVTQEQANRESLKLFWQE